MVGTVRIFSVPPSALVEDAALAPLPRPLAALPAPRTPPEDVRDLLRVWTPAGAVALIALAVVTVDLIFELAVLTPAVALDTAVVFPARARPDIKHGEALRARLSKKKKTKATKEATTGRPSERSQRHEHPLLPVSDSHSALDGAGLRGCSPSLSLLQTLQTSRQP